MATTTVNIPDSFTRIPKGQLITLVGNKSDLEDERAFTQAEAESVANSLGSSYTEVSAKTGEGIEQLFKEIAKAMPIHTNDEERKESDMCSLQ